MGLKTVSGDRQIRWDLKPPRGPGDPVGLKSFPGDWEILWDLKASLWTGRSHGT